MRLFIGIDISGDVKENISEIQSRLKTISADVKWVDSSRFHLTLKFLGEVREEKKDLIIMALSKAVKGISRFTVDLAGIGAFPSIDRPKVIWAGVGRGEQELKELFLKIDTELEKVGFQKEEKCFSGHLTIGRIRSQQNIDLLVKKIALNAKMEFGSFPVNKIDLIMSTLLPGGPEYKCLNSISIATI